jgi:hypothetical protein
MATHQKQIASPVISKLPKHTMNTGKAFVEPNAGRWMVLLGETILNTQRASRMVRIISWKVFTQILFLVKLDTGFIKVYFIYLQLENAIKPLDFILLRGFQAQPRSYFASP